MTTTSLEGKVTAKLEIELGQPTGARPGAPPRHMSSASQHQAPASGAARRPCHRGPAAKAKSRARAAAYQAAKAAASAAQQSESESTPASPAPVGAPSTQPLNILSSPPASDGRRLVVSVGRSERLPSFSQLDGQDSTIVSPLSSSVEVEEVIPDPVRRFDCRVATVQHCGFDKKPNWQGRRRKDCVRHGETSSDAT